MHRERIRLELLDAHNVESVRTIQREDVSEAYVDGVDVLMELTQYGIEHHCLGHTYAIRYDDAYIGVILLGEAIPWETDPPQIYETPFYRLMGFVLDKHWRGMGIGGVVLEMAIEAIYQEYGVRPIALGCHEENCAAARFYLRHGFIKTDAKEGNDVYYLRYPNILG